MVHQEGEEKAAAAVVQHQKKNDEKRSNPVIWTRMRSRSVPNPVKGQVRPDQIQTNEQYKQSRSRRRSRKNTGGRGNQNPEKGEAGGGKIQKREYQEQHGQCTTKTFSRRTMSSHNPEIGEAGAVQIMPLMSLKPIIPLMALSGLQNEQSISGGHNCKSNGNRRSRNGRSCQNLKNEEAANNQRKKKKEQEEHNQSRSSRERSGAQAEDGGAEPIQIEEKERLERTTEQSHGNGDMEVLIGRLQLLQLPPYIPPQEIRNEAKESKSKGSRGRRRKSRRSRCSSNQEGREMENLEQQAAVLGIAVADEDGMPVIPPPLHPLPLNI